MARSGWFMCRPALSMSWNISSGESLIPSLACSGVPVAAMSPPLMMLLPPGTGIFSRTITLAPAFLASNAAAKPAKPLPITTTSTVWSHFLGSSVAPASLVFIKSPEVARPTAAAAPPACFRKLRLDVLSLSAESVVLAIMQLQVVDTSSAIPNPNRHSVGYGLTIRAIRYNRANCQFKIFCYGLDMGRS